MEDKVTYEDIVKCRKMLTDRVLVYREWAHKISGATFAIIGGIFLLVGIVACDLNNSDKSEQKNVAIPSQEGEIRLKRALVESSFPCKKREVNLKRALVESSRSIELPNQSKKSDAKVKKRKRLF